MGQRRSVLGSEGVEIAQLALQVVQTIAMLFPCLAGGNRMPEQSTKGEAMATVLTMRGAEGHTKDVRVVEDPATINGTLAVASKESHPFVVFTNAETGKEESFQPERVVSFAAE
jgi:hypothetical protein